MEKRIIGVVLTILGIVGLIMAGMNFMNNGNSDYNVKSIVMYGVLGLIFFMAGIGLIRSTKDVAKNNEHVS